MQKINDFMNTVLSNGNVKQMMDTEISDGPHTEWNSRIVHAWVVSQKENDYLPVHAHSEIVNGYQNSKISAVPIISSVIFGVNKPDIFLFTWSNTCLLYTSPSPRD